MIKNKWIIKYTINPSISNITASQTEVKDSDIVKVESKM